MFHYGSCFKCIFITWVTVLFSVIRLRLSTCIVNKSTIFHMYSSFDYNTLVSGSSGPGSSNGWGHCVVILGRTLYS